MEVNSIITFLVCIIMLFLFGKLFIMPIKSIMKLIINSAFGAVIIFLINLVGKYFGFYIGLNIITAIFVGILGIPGAILLIILKIFFG